MQQSAKLLERRPVRLKRLAADSASERSNISASGRSCRARDSAAIEMGPQRNSPQATVLIPSVSPAWSQPTTRASSLLPGRSASIRKFVSRWITVLDALPSGFRDGLLPCSGTSLGQTHCLLQLAENSQQIFRSLRHGLCRILHGTLHSFLRRHTPSLTQATERSGCHLIKVNSQCRMSHAKTLHAATVSDNMKLEFCQFEVRSNACISAFPHFEFPIRATGAQSPFIAVPTAVTENLDGDRRGGFNLLLRLFGTLVGNRVRGG